MPALILVALVAVIAWGVFGWVAGALVLVASGITFVATLEAAAEEFGDRDESEVP